MSEMTQLVRLLNEININVNSKLDSIESRLATLEKVNSIEHRVAVNQIDIGDIKELLQKIEEHPFEKVTVAIEETLLKLQASYQKNFDNISKRLDTQLLMIAKTEEEMLSLKESVSN
ncbi:hypothetical protein M3175_12420 [Robertmurraya korlensis]|uniref:hypothetical protein n=1 Tax=Robertmurraya korlensis TaxID=519977 RepID=UPI002041AB71|nr:hypothetical protein [Robertmurraya korlensis]MCM3601541.1 hypothetical protein [Robertmurraya korlensis]